MMELNQTVRNRAFGVIFIFFWGCASAVPRVNPAQLDQAIRIDPRVMREFPALGREIYLNKCGGCHSLIPPRQLSIARWREVLPVMADRAKMTADETEKVGQYLFTVLLPDK